MMLAHEQSTTACAPAPTFGNRRAVSAGKLNFMLFPWCQVNWNASNDVWIFGSPDSFCWQAASYLIVLDLFNRDGVKTCYSGTPAVCTGATTDLPLPAAARSAPHRLQRQRVLRSADTRVPGVSSCPFSHRIGLSPSPGHGARSRVSELKDGLSAEGDPNKCQIGPPTMQRAVHLPCRSPSSRRRLVAGAPLGTSAVDPEAAFTTGSSRLV